MKFLHIAYSISILLAFVAFIAPEKLVSQNQQDGTEAIKIGLLIPDSKSIEARFGAELAIREANEKGGINGRPLLLVTRSMEGPWGTGSKEAVNLIFKEKVWAIMGSHNGRNAHLVEQVTTKTRIVFLSAWASDPTLSQAFIPWYFSCVPNGIQQANALITEIYNKRKLDKIAVVTDEAYDSKKSLQSLLKQTKLLGKPEPTQLLYDNTNRNYTALFDKINEADIHGIILFGSPATSLSFVQQLREKKMNQPVFGTLSLLGEHTFNNIEITQYKHVSIITSGNWLQSKELSFQTEFRKEFNEMPGAVAAYAFDGMHLIIEAIKNSGLDREKMQEAMSKTHYEGVTGHIEFDKKGNRAGVIELIKIND